jgi:hypothetical protein
MIASGSVNGANANFTTANISGTVTAGKLISNSNINGTALNISGMTNGSIAFFGPNGALSQNNAKLFWDKNNNRFAVGSNNSLTSTFTAASNAINETAMSVTAFAGNITDIFKVTDSANSTLISFGKNGNTLFNAQGLPDADFRIDGDNQGRLLFVDAGLDNIGIGTGTPTSFKLEVKGNVGPSADGTFNLGSNTKKWNKIFVNTINATTLSTSLTAGSVIFAGTTGELAQDNTNFFWNNTTKKFGIGAGTNPSAGLTVGSGTNNNATGADDIYVTDDIEVDGTAFATNFNGSSATFTATARANKLISDSNVNGTTANFTTVNATNFNGSFPVGSVLFANASGVISQSSTKLFWDNTNSRLGIGTSTPAASLTVAPSAMTETAFRVQAFPTQFTNIMQITNSAGSALINVGINGSTTFNEQGLADANFRIESDTHEHMVFVNSSTNRVGIKTSAPSTELDINGTLAMRGGNPQQYYVLASTDSTGRADWMDISTIITNGGTFLNALNDAISDKNSNLFLGNGSGLNNTGKNNTAVGILALGANTSGNGNTALGFKAGNPNTKGNFNTALGAEALNANTSGNGNIALGYRAGDNILTGSYNITIGHDLNAVSPTSNYQLNIGDAIFGNLSTKRINIGFSTNTPDASLEIGNGFATYINGNDDILVADDIEVDDDAFINGTVFTTNFNGTTLNTQTIVNTGTATVNKLISSTNVNGQALTIAGTTTFSQFTAGSIPFFGASGVLTQDNLNFYYDDATDRFLLGGNSTATADIMLAANGATVFNEQGNNVSFRVESDTKTSAIFINGSDGNVGINTSTPNSGLQLASSLALPISTKTTSYTLTQDDHTVLSDATAGAMTISLPSPTGIAGRVYVIKKIDASVNIVKVRCSGTDTIDGNTERNLTVKYESIKIQTDGTNWYII